jgi:hypothetical protein
LKLVALLMLDLALLALYVALLVLYLALLALRVWSRNYNSA